MEEKYTFHLKYQIEHKQEELPLYNLLEVISLIIKEKLKRIFH